MRAPALEQDWKETDSGLIVPEYLQDSPTAIDLFCGCGGFSLGIMQAGFDVVAAADNDPTSLQTYLYNLGADRVDIRFVEPEDEERLEEWMQRHLIHESEGGVATISSVSGGNRSPGTRGVPVFWFGNLSKLTGERMLDSVGLERGELDLVVGGPPCQGMSMAGKRRVDDPRNNLLFEFARLIVEMQPRTMCMENVPGILSMTTPTGAPILDEFCRILERGDFGEFDALRSILTGERKAVSRGAGKKKPRRGKKPKAPREDQLEFEF